MQSGRYQRFAYIKHKNNRRQANFFFAMSEKVRTFASGFGRPKRAPRGNRVQIPNSPAAVSSNEFATLDKKPLPGRKAGGKAERNGRNKSEDLPEPEKQSPTALEDKD